MAFTVAAVIEEARDQHAAFDAERTPDAVCIRHVSRYTRELYARVVEKNDQLYVNSFEETLPLADFVNGFALPADFMKILGGHVTDVAEYQHVLQFVSHRNRWHPGCHTPVYILNQTVYFCGYEGDWLKATKAVIHYIPEPTLPTAAADTVPLPDGSSRVVAENLAFFMARRSHAYEGEAVPAALFYQSWRESEKEFLVEIAQHSRQQFNVIREEW